MSVLHDDYEFNIFVNMLNCIHSEFKKIIEDSFHNNVSNYVENNKYNPYDISVPMQDVIDLVECNFLDIVSEISIIFDSVSELEDVMDRFTEYYHYLLEVVGKQDLTLDDKTLIVALDLIFIHKKNTNTLKKVYNILRSMCKFPSLGVLVQVTDNVLCQS